MSHIEPQHEALIVGAGLGGIGAGVALQRAGIDDFVIVEKWHGVGGTWLANTYPGVAVDIPAFIYSFSYEQRSDWSRLFAPGDEIRRYAEDVVDKRGLRPKLRLNTTLTRCEFDEADDVWRVQTDAGEELTARFLIPALGGLERPKLPDIEGITDFGGTLMHTALWDHDVDLAGKRVAVIGTGATSLQLIPELAKVASPLTVFQRTPIWVGPKIDFEVGAVQRFVLSQPLVRWYLRSSGTVGAELGLGAGFALPDQIGVPLRRRAERQLRGWMRRQLAGHPELQEQLIPQYALGCKRPSMSNTYLKTFTLDHVDLVTDPIQRVTETGVVTADGVEREIDVLVCATGFRVMDRGHSPPFPVIGRDGVDLGSFWHEHRFQAYQGVSVPRFPNLFMITGPHGFVPGSYFWMVESTSAHAARVIAQARRRGATRAEIRQEPHDRYFQRCTERAQKTLLFTENCAATNTYYINYQGDAAALRPSTYGEMWFENRFFPLDNYRYGTAPAVSPTEAAPARRTQTRGARR
ncbi:MAG: flavin-containing monooxygenase [Acidimicrobiales bacterium]